MNEESAFVLSPLPLPNKLFPPRRSSHPFPRVLVCSADSRGAQVRLTRRAVLAALAASLLAPAASKAQDAPQTGFISRSGLKYFDFVLGEGATPQWGDFVNIHYVAYTISTDGNSLVKGDSSYDYGDDGYLIHHGNGETIRGIEEALHTMSPGGKRRVIIPAALAYTTADLGPIPSSHRKRKRFSKALQASGGTVVFDLELRTVMKDWDDRGYYSDEIPDDEGVIKMMEEAREEYLKDKDSFPEPAVTITL